MYTMNIRVKLPCIHEQTHTPIYIHTGIFPFKFRFDYKTFLFFFFINYFFYTFFSRLKNIKTKSLFFHFFSNRNIFLIGNLKCQGNKWEKLWFGIKFLSGFSIILKGECFFLRMYDAA